MGGTRRPRLRIAAPTLRRSDAASRDRPGVGAIARDSDCRRAHWEPGYCERRPGAQAPQAVGGRPGRHGLDSDSQRRSGRHRRCSPAPARRKGREHRAVKLFRSLILRPLRRDLLRATLTAIAVALGVAVVVAIDLAGDAAAGSFQSSLTSVVGKVDLEIVANGGIDEAYMGKLAA